MVRSDRRVGCFERWFDSMLITCCLKVKRRGDLEGREEGRKYTCVLKRESKERWVTVLGRRVIWVALTRNRGLYHWNFSGGFGCL